jgi:hypothetical protein
MRRDVLGRIQPQGCEFEKEGVGRQIRGLAPKYLTLLLVQ